LLARRPQLAMQQAALLGHGGVCRRRACFSRFRVGSDVRRPCRRPVDIGLLDRRNKACSRRRKLGRYDRESSLGIASSIDPSRCPRPASVAVARRGSPGVALRSPCQRRCLLTLASSNCCGNQQTALARHVGVLIGPHLADRLYLVRRADRARRRTYHGFVCFQADGRLNAT
jgi:hypothetical protein